MTSSPPSRPALGLGRTAWAALLPLVVAFGLAACGPRGATDGGLPVVATVDGQPITTSDVEALLPAEDGGEPVLLPRTPAPDPRRDALQLAVRTKLLAREALARGLPAGPPEDPAAAEAERAQALLAEERSRHALAPSSIGDREAQGYYATRRHQFDEVASMRVSYLKLADGSLAQRLLAGAEQLPTGGFLELAERHRPAVQESGRVVLDHDGHGAGISGAAEIPVARVAFALRRPDRAGLVRSRDDGRWYLVRVDAVALRSQPWTPELAARVKTAMAWEREQRHLRRLTDELSRRWVIHVYPDRLAAVRVAGAASPAGP